MAGTMEHTTVLLTWQKTHKFAALPSVLQVLCECDQYIFHLQGLVDTTHHADHALIFIGILFGTGRYIPQCLPSLFSLYLMLIFADLNLQTSLKAD